MISFHFTGIIFIHGFITLISTLTVGRQIKKICVTVLFLLCLILYFSAISKCKTRGVYIRRGDFTKGFFPLRVCEEGLIFGGACFLNFTLFAKPTD